VIGNHVNQVG